MLYQVWFTQLNYDIAKLKKGIMPTFSEI